ncbi:hypothetical protein BDW02DRAFT_177527 [Decorospora gaudefroyi]|uniref:Uncharacterized protein n=1 Tax=Decorospora gaudefroyi TaxID=184978 RepID=A0A6A5JZP4_9PLEO|nr:hypothetical protein BDW02DRAFT_177527 [Decorospora gaudefroyi]
MESGLVSRGKGDSFILPCPFNQEGGSRGQTRDREPGRCRRATAGILSALEQCKPEDAPSGYSQLPWEPITMDVKGVVFSASPDKAPGRDGLPARAWRELWPATNSRKSFLSRSRRGVSRE